MGLDLFVKLKFKSSTITLFVGIRHSMCDLLSDLNNYAWWQISDMRPDDASAPSGISSPE